MQRVLPPQSDSSTALFAIELTFPIDEFQQDWKQCSLLANYIAEYTAYQFDQQERAENIVSTITNELLEAIVYLAPTQSDLIIHLEQLEDGLQLKTSHLVRENLIAPYIKFLEELKLGVADEPYLNLLTSPEPSDHYFNQLGLMMISHDFGAQIVRLPTMQPDRFCTQLFIANEEFQA
ncbi:MAG: hypothetical protein IAF02_00700 [Anaerolineae bacterium]|nr:hypothetical protein [Anaerolineae bacterium]